MEKSLSKKIGPAISIMLFAIALAILHHELRKYHYSDIISGLKAIPPGNLLLALAFTVLNYLALASFDILAVKYIQKRLAYPKVILTSFISYAFSHNMGLSILSGGSVRYYLYTAWGLTAVEVARVVAFCAVTYVIGLITISGSVIMIVPQLIPPAIYSGAVAFRPFGLLLLGVSASYLLLSAFRERPFRFRGWEFRMPSAALALSQILLASVEFALIGAVIYVLLPESVGVSYPEFLAVFLMANIAGMLSHIPGGLGVFETVVILLLSPAAPSAPVVSALIVYRGMYFIFPFMISLLLFGGFEAVQRKKAVKRAAAAFNFAELLPPFFAFMAFLSGLSLALSGALSKPSGISLFTEVSVGLLYAVTGAALLVLSRALSRRVHKAYSISAALLSFGLALTLVAGAPYIYALPSALTLLLFIPAGGVFYRKSSILHEPFTPGWVASVVLALLSLLWAGFSIDGAPVRLESLFGPGFLSFTAASLTAGVFFVMKRLLYTPHVPELLPDSKELDMARSIALDSARPFASLALSADKSVFLSPAKKAFLMYSVIDNTWVSLGGPFGHKAEGVELAWHFSEMAAVNGGVPVFYNAAGAELRLYSDLGLTHITIGDEAEVPLGSQSRLSALESEYERLKAEGLRIELTSVEDEALLHELDSINDEWLWSLKNERVFCEGSFSPYYIKSGLVALVRHRKRLIGFANILTSGQGVIYPDMIRYRKDSPAELLYFLLLGIIMEGKKEGYSKVSLGLMPSIDGEELVTSKAEYLGAFYDHSEHFRNLNELKHLKMRFSPELTPRYLAYPGGFELPKVLDDIASIILRERAQIKKAAP